MNARIDPRAAWTDFTPTGPWADGTVVVRNLDGVGFTYSASLNALTVNPNISYIAKNANNFKITNLPDPTSNLDAANKEYVDSHAGTGGGTPGGTANQIQYNNSGAFGGFTMGGDATLVASSGILTLSTVNTNVGTFQGISVNGKGLVTGATNMGYAPLASPTFTGTPAAPTVATADNSTTIATTAYVKNQGYATSGAIPPPSSTVPVMDSTGAVGTATAYARGDHVHPSDTSRAPLASPAFTGTPTAPTPTSTDSSTNIATTAFVKAQGYIIANQTITLSGDVTGSGSTAITSTIAASAVTNAKMANAAAYTLKGNPTSASAAPQDFTFASLTSKGAPVAADTVLISDSVASGAIKTAPFSAFGGTGSSPIPTGTVMPFFQSAAPTGWTQVTTQNDKAIRVVSGTGGVSGGTNPFLLLWLKLWSVALRYLLLQCQHILIPHGKQLGQMLR
jgi:hypothetical protein